MPTPSEFVKYVVGIIAAPLLDGAFWLYEKWEDFDLKRERARDLS